MKFSNRCTSLTKAGRRCKNHKKQGQEVCGIHYKMETKYDFCLDLLFDGPEQDEPISEPETPISTPVISETNSSDKLLEEIAKWILELDCNLDNEMEHGNWTEDTPFVQTVNIKLDNIFRKIAIKQ